MPSNEEGTFEDIEPGCYKIFMEDLNS